MTEAASFAFVPAIVILLATVAVLGLAAWLGWGVVSRWRRAGQPGRTARAIALERQNLTKVETAELAMTSIRARHEAAMAGLRGLRKDASPAEALRVVRAHLPSTDFAALITALGEQWEQSRHPPYLAALAGLALRHVDEGLFAIADFRETTRKVFEAAPAKLLAQASAGLLQRADRLGHWLLAGGLEDVRSAAATRQEAAEAAALVRLGQALEQRGATVALDFAAWAVARCEQEGAAGDPARLATMLAYDCRPIMGEPLALARAAFARHGDEPRWRAAGLTFEAMLVDVHGPSGLAGFDFAGVLERLREGLVAHDWSVANAAGHAAADIAERGYLRDEEARFALKEGLDWSANVHWPRPQGQQRLEGVLAEAGGVWG